MTYEQVNNRTFLKSLAKRQRELTESNAKILGWAMKTVSNKKKVSLPQIRISDSVPYTIVPPIETNQVIPFLNTNPDKERPSKPCKETVKNKAPGVTKKKELTPVEEVEEYLRMEVSKEKATRSKKENCPALPYLFPLCNQYQILDKFNKIENSLQDLCSLLFDFFRLFSFLHV